MIALVRDVNRIQRAWAVIKGGVTPLHASPTLGELRDLAVRSPTEGPEIIKTLFQWRQDRAMAVARGFLGAAISLLAAAVVTILTHGVKVSGLLQSVFAGAIVILTVVGALAYGWVRNIHRGYMQALLFFADLCDTFS